MHNIRYKNVVKSAEAQNMVRGTHLAGKLNFYKISSLDGASFYEQYEINTNCGYEM